MTRGRVPPRCPGPVMTIVSPAGASPHRQLKPGNRPPSPQTPHIVHPGQRDERCRRRLRERAGQRLSTAGAAGRCAVRTSAPRVPFLVASAGWLTVLTGKIPCCLGRRPAPPVRLRLPLVLVTPFPAAGSTRHRGPSAAGRSRRGPRPLPVQLPGDRRERCCVTVRLGAGQFRCQGEHRLLRQHRALLHLSRPRRRGGAAARFSPDGPGGRPSRAGLPLPTVVWLDLAGGPAAVLGEIACLPPAFRRLANRGPRRAALRAASFPGGRIFSYLAWPGPPSW